MSDSSSKGFYLAKYFCDCVLPPLQPEWAGLRDNLTPSAARPTAFYASVLSSFQATDLPPGFTYTSRAFYKVLLEDFLHHPDFPWPLVRLRPLSVFPFSALGSDP